MSIQNYRKELCTQCNLDGKCCCQDTEKGVDDCGMESVISSNDRYNRALKNGTLTQGFDNENY